MGLVLFATWSNQVALSPGPSDHFAADGCSAKALEIYCQFIPSCQWTALCGLFCLLLWMIPLLEFLLSNRKQTFKKHMILWFTERSSHIKTGVSQLCPRLGFGRIKLSISQLSLTLGTLVSWCGHTLLLESTLLSKSFVQHFYSTQSWRNSYFSASVAPHL